MGYWSIVENPFCENEISPQEVNDGSVVYKLKPEWRWLSICSFGVRKTTLTLPDTKSATLPEPKSQRVELHKHETSFVHTSEQIDEYIGKARDLLRRIRS